MRNQDSFRDRKPKRKAYANGSDNVGNVSEELLDSVIDDLNGDIAAEINRIKALGVTQLLQWAYVVTVGTGKTYALTLAAVEAVKKGWRVAIRTPTTRLALELQAEIDKHCANAAGVWLGRGQKDPRNPLIDMCPRAAEVVAAQKVGGDPNDVCGSKKRGFCRFHPEVHTTGCGYKRQNLREKHIVIFAGDSMLELTPRDPMKRSEQWIPYGGAQRTQAPRKPLARHTEELEARIRLDLSFDLLLLDETDPQGLIHWGQEAAGLNCQRALMNNLSKDPQGQAILELFLTEALSQIAEGKNYLAPFRYQSPNNDLEWNYLETFPVEAQGEQLVSSSARTSTEALQKMTEQDKFLTLETLSTVREVAFENLPSPRDKDKFQRLTATQIYQRNKENSITRGTLLNIIKICELMIQATRDDLLDLKHLAIIPETGTITVSYLKSINIQYLFLPIMVFDATMRIDLAGCILPNLKVRYQRNVSDGSGVRRFQLLDSSLSYSTLKSSETWNARLNLWAELCCLMHGRTGLLVPKFLRAALEEYCSKKVFLGHYGDLKGTNDFEKVDALILVSRPAVQPKIAEEAAAIISGKNIVTLGDTQEWYPRKQAAIRYRRAPEYGWDVYHECHPDKIAEAVRGSVTEDSVEQALGRGRYVRRTCERPITEYLLTNVPTKRLVDGVFKAAEFKAVSSWIGLLLFSGIWFSPESKGSSELMHLFALNLKSQRPDSLYISLLGDPAFESAASAGAWKKKQLQDNFELNRLAHTIDDAFINGGSTVGLLQSALPLSDFKVIRAKVRGSRYYARVYVRTEGEQTPAQALECMLGGEFKEIELKT